MNSHLTSEQTTKVVTTLHSILKPFLLRRLKADVEYSLPPKKEYVLYAPLTEQQKRIYEAVVNRSLRSLLIEGQEHEKEKEKAEERKKKDLERMLTEKRQLRKRGQKRYYDVDGSDRDYFKKLESGELDKFAPENRFRKEKSSLELGKEYYHRKAGKRYSPTNRFMSETLTLIYRNSGEQYAPSKRRHAAPQSLFTPFPL